mmetsp:Transcript_59350/g.165722  ORF Transcript_59350/g.165722 Transcript_59350/m.165722 type:complete len:497 (-) Transcript_59350:96-1586(-)
MALDALSVDSLLQVLSYMNAQSLARMAYASRFGAVAAHEAQQRPALLVLKGRPDEVAQGLREKLAARPTVAFLQYCSPDRVDRSAEMLHFIRRRLPPEIEVLGAETNSLHCLLRPDDQQAKSDSTVLQVCDSNTAPEHIGLLVATLPEAEARSFHIPDDDLTSGSSEDSSEQWSEADEDEDDVNADGIRQVDEGVVGGERQTEAVAAETDGAVNQQWLASLSIADEGGAKDVQENAQAAVAEQGNDLPEAERAGDQPNPIAELLALDPAPQVIVVHLACRSAAIVHRLQAAYPRAAVIGGIVMGDSVVSRGRAGASAGSGVGVLTIAGNAPLFAMTCPYTTKPVEEVRRKMRRAQDMTMAEERRVLGALLFTCNGRGRQTFQREANDALLFQAQFPNAQLLGHYAGGEIGPKVRRCSSQNQRARTDSDVAANDDDSAFLRGNAELQGFTAVFGFFLVPRKQVPSRLFHRAVLHGEVQEAFMELRRMREGGRTTSCA